MISLGRLLLIAAAAWCGGLAWFIGDAVQPSPPPPQADGIVVLTGDADRVETALSLLAQGRGRLLLISGAGPRYGFDELARRYQRDQAALALGKLQTRVTLGRDAVSTWGNAAEFAAWAGRDHISSAIVVTSYYHMRRALLEIGRTAPEVKLSAVKVPASPRIEPDDWRKLIEDYNKYLLALLGLSRFSPGHRAA